MKPRDEDRNVEQRNYEQSYFRRPKSSSACLPNVWEMPPAVSVSGLEVKDMQMLSPWDSALKEN